jgi:hypothetical protein
MTLTPSRVSVVSVAALALALLLPTSARAQSVTFTDVRDAVPGKFFNPSPDSTRVDPAAPNTLLIGLESGFDSATFLERNFRATTDAFGNRVAADTLAFDVVAPEGYYVSSITYEQAGGGSVVRVADARGNSSWIVNGQPASLGVFRTDPTLARTITFTDSRLTVVSVSITTSLFAFAPPTSGEATVGLSSAKVVATVAPLGPTDVKKSALIQVSGFTGTYDGLAHGATGTATGGNGEDLSSLLTLGQTFVDAPGGTAEWTFAGNTEYNAGAGSVAVTITPADATISVAGYSGTYDGAAHGATGTATGVNNEDLSALIDLGAAFTNVPGGTANWTFAGGGNYNAASGEVPITIAKATPVLVWPQPAPVVAGTALTTTQLNATSTVAGTFVYSPPLGTILTATQQLSVTFTPTDAVNYNGATAAVTITVEPNTGAVIVNPGPQTDMVGDDVRLRIRLTGGSREDQRGVFTAAGLPPGLAISPDGIIQGKVTTVGTSLVTVTFTHNDVAVSTQFEWTVVPRSRKGGKG